MCRGGLMRTIFLLCKRGLLAFSLTMICAGFAGCASVPPREVARQLPPVPDRLMHPVREPDAAKGVDARAVMRNTGSALYEANRRLKASADWYAGIRDAYGK